MDLFYKARPDYASMQQKIQSLKEEFAQLKGFLRVPHWQRLLGRDIMAMSHWPAGPPHLVCRGHPCAGMAHRFALFSFF